MTEPPTVEADVDHSFATVNGVDLHYVTTGPADGELVLLLHGFPEFWYGWRRLLPALAAAGFRVVAPDMRGYNRSGKPDGVHAYHIDELVADVAGLVEHFDRETAHVVGHDWGGQVAWQVGIDRPDVLDRLCVLNAPHPSAYERELGSLTQLRKAWYVFFYQVPWLPEWSLTRNDCELLEDIFRGTATTPDAFSDADIERYREAFGREGAAEAAVNYYRSMFRRFVKLTLFSGGVGDRPVEVPTLVVWGEQDPALSTSLLDGLDRWVPDLRIERVPEASHWVQHDCPERVNESLLGFLDET